MSPSSNDNRRFSSSSAHSLDVSDYIRQFAEDEDGVHSTSYDPYQFNTLSTSSIPSTLPPENLEGNKLGMQDGSARAGGRTGTGITIDEQEHDIHQHHQKRSHTSINSGMDLRHETESFSTRRYLSSREESHNKRMSSASYESRHSNQTLRRGEKGVGSQHSAILHNDPYQLKNSKSTIHHSIPSNRPPVNQIPNESGIQHQSFRVGGRKFTRITIGGDEQQNLNPPHQNRSRAFDSGTVMDSNRDTESRRDRRYSSNQYGSHQKRRGGITADHSGHSNQMLGGGIGFHSTPVLNNDNDRARMEAAYAPSRRWAGQPLGDERGYQVHSTADAGSTGNMFHDVEFAQKYSAELSRLISNMESSERSRKSVNEIKKFMASEQFKRSFDNSDPRQISGSVRQITGTTSSTDDVNVNSSDADADADADKNSNRDQKQGGTISFADIKASRRKPRRRTKAKPKTKTVEKSVKPNETIHESD